MFELGNPSGITAILDLANQHRGGYPVRLRRIDPRQQVGFMRIELRRPLPSIRIDGHYAQVPHVSAHSVAGYAQLLGDGANNKALTV